MLRWVGAADDQSPAARSWSDSGAVTLALVSEDPDRARFGQGLRRALRQPWRLNEATRLSLDAFAQRYAAGHGLSYAPAGTTPPATWFLETVEPTKSHSFLRGRLAGGADGGLFYAERAVPVKRGQVMDGWTVALYEIPAATRLAYGIACRFRPGADWRGRIPLAMDVPRGLLDRPLGHPALDERFQVTVGEDDGPAVTRLLDSQFLAWLEDLPWQRTGDGVTRFELRGASLCVYAKPKARTASELNVFCERAAHIAGQVGEASAGS